MKGKVAFLIVFLFLWNSSSDELYACKGAVKGFVKELEPYTFSGQINTVELQNGMSVFVSGALLGGQEYKVMVASKETSGPMGFRLIDNNKKVIFDNAAHGMTQSWVFKVTQSATYTVALDVPKGDQKKAASEGICAGVLIGFKAAN